MAERIKLTKNELKKQKDDLKRFNRYLPTLKLKQQQLQSMLQKISYEVEALKKRYQSYVQSIDAWIAVFGDPHAKKIEEYITHTKLISEIQNTAGVDVPVFIDLEVNIEDYDLFTTPYWLDDGIEALIDVLKMAAELETLSQQYALIEKELRTTIQRVNLFEKVKIPETRRNIRVIQIYLGDQQTASVVRGKITKGRIVEEELSA